MPPAGDSSVCVAMSLMLLAVAATASAGGLDMLLVQGLSKNPTDWDAEAAGRSHVG